MRILRLRANRWSRSMNRLRSAWRKSDEPENRYQMQNKDLVVCGRPMIILFFILKKQTISSECR
jgi:hypothetical protein